ncbi:MAG: cytochrome c3 family protein [Phycisphaerales bacterium]
MSVRFPIWMNVLPTVGAVGGAAGLVATIAIVTHYFTPEYWEVGYMPTQPGSGFSHQIHAGKLGMDCRYCHTNVEKSAEANVPPVSTCMGCHTDGMLAPTYDPGEKVEFVRTAWTEDASIPWARIHKLPDYVRNFPHHVHINAGVSCYSCHGQIEAMPIVYQAHSLSMAWCLDCHRGVEDSMYGEDDPAKYLVPHDRVTDVEWAEQTWLGDMAGTEAQRVQAMQVLEGIRRAPPENCGACHY